MVLPLRPSLGAFCGHPVGSLDVTLELQAIGVEVPEKPVLL